MAFLDKDLKNAQVTVHGPWIAPPKQEVQMNASFGAN
jgi:hypothetical protein